MRKTRLAFLFILILSSSFATGGDTDLRRRIAVFDFDRAAAQGGMTSPFFETVAPNTGKAVTDLLITRLVQRGTVSVIERAAIDKLLAEQNLSNSDRTDPLTAARIGRVLGIDGIVLGTITKWDYDDKVTGGGGTRLGGLVGGSSTKMKHDIKARVEITARLVSPETAEVLAVGQGVGEILRKGVKIDMRDTGQYAMLGIGNANNPIMSEALDTAVTQLATQLEKDFPKLPPRNLKIEGLVADANEAGRLVLNVGALNGIKRGDQLEVWRPGKEIRDPATGRLLMREDVLLGNALVNTVMDVSSIATYSGTEKVKVGDIVKSLPKQ